MDFANAAPLNTMDVTYIITDGLKRSDFSNTCKVLLESGIGANGVKFLWAAPLRIDKRVFTILTSVNSHRYITRLFTQESLCSCS
jgi:hypothetical protein